jgi:hypothetical protein
MAGGIGADGGAGSGSASATRGAGAAGTVLAGAVARFLPVRF